MFFWKKKKQKEEKSRVKFTEGEERERKEVRKNMCGRWRRLRLASSNKQSNNSYRTNNE